MKITWTLAAAAALSLAACEGEAAPKAPPSPAAPPTGPLQAAGAALTVQADPEADLQWAASVVRVDPLPGLDAKLFGVAGGDPAMNGLQTYLAFFVSPADGWRVFPVGDILDYRVLRSSAGRIELEISDNVMGEDGEIGSRTRRLILSWTPVADDAPQTIAVTPAR